jgi:two-component system NtrC family sensor kinase
MASRLTQVFRTISQLGITDHTDVSLRKRISISNLLSATIALITFPYIFIFYFAGSPYLSQLVILIVSGYVAVSLLNWQGYQRLSRVWMIALPNIAVTYFSLALGDGAGIHFYYFANICLPVIVLLPKERWMMVGGIGVPLILLSYLIINGSSHAPIVDVTPSAKTWIEFSIGVSTVLTIAASLLYFLYQNEKALKHVTREYNERLLMEIQLKSVFDNAQDTISVIDRDMKIVNINNCVSVYESTPEEVIGKSLYELLGPEEAKVHVDIFRGVFESGKPANVVQSFKGTNGKIYWHSLGVSPTFDPDGEVKSAIGISRDITALKHSEMERERLLKELTHASKLASLGTISAGIGHELNNPLTSVKGFAELIQKSSQDPEICQWAELIHKSSNRMKEIISQLRRFSRDTSADDWEAVDLKKVLQDPLTLLHGELSLHKISMTLEISDVPLLVYGNRVQLESVFQNFTANSIGAFLEVSDDRKREISVSTQVSDGSVHIEYSDNASGIDEEHLSLVFDPFFTTKGVGRGTGLGLSVSHDIAKKHKGDLSVTSKPGAGTTFLLKLPLMIGQVERVEEKTIDKSAPPMASGNRKLIIIDDEEDICELLKEVCSPMLQVQTFTDGREALAQLKENPVDLILCDLRMPTIGGELVFEQVTAMGLGIPFVVITGSPDDELVTKLLEKGATGVLVKPFQSVDRLLHDLNAWMDSGASKHPKGSKV